MLHYIYRSEQPTYNSENSKIILYELNTTHCCIFWYVPESVGVFIHMTIRYIECSVKYGKITYKKRDFPNKIYVSQGFQTFAASTFPYRVP